MKKKIILYVQFGRRKIQILPPERRGRHYPRTAVLITSDEIMKGIDEVKNKRMEILIISVHCIFLNVCEFLSRAEVAGCTDEDVGISTVQ